MTSDPPFAIRRSFRLLYIMIKLPPPLADWIGELPQRALNRPPDLLHITVLPLGDRADLGEGFVDQLCRMLGRFRAALFRVAFDCIHDNGKSIALCASEALNAAMVFQQNLVDFLAASGVRVTPRYRFSPHITLNYQSHGQSFSPIDTISWLVEDFRLVESVHGETRHEELGCWPLRHADAAR